MKITKRIWAWLLCLAMLSAFIPATVSHADDTKQWWYVATIKVKDKKGAGTNSTVQAKYVAGGIALYETIGKVGRNSSKSVTFNTNIAPWEITSFGMYNTGSDAVCIEYATLTVVSNKYITNPSKYKILVSSSDWNKTYTKGEKWIETQKGSSYWTAATVTVKGYSSLENDELDDLKAQFSGTTVLNEKEYVTNDMSDDPLSVTWDGIVSDQYMTEYSIFDYNSEPTATFDISAIGKTVSLTETTSQTYSTANGNVGAFGIETYAGKDDGKIGFEIASREDLLKVMNAKEVNCITINITISFPSGRVQSTTKTIKGTYTIVRNVFEIGDITYSTGYFTQHEDRKYYNVSTVENKDTKNLVVTVPIIHNTANFKHFNNKSGANYSINGVYVAFSEAKLLVNEGTTEAENVYITTTQKNATTNSDGKFQISFPLAEGYDSGNNGFKLILTGVRTYIKQSSSKPGTTFYLHTAGDDYSSYLEMKNPTEADYASTEYLDSRYKIDTVTPTATVTAAEGSKALDVCSQTKTIKFTADEAVYHKLDSEFKNEELTFSLAYYDEAGTKKNVQIYDQDGAGSLQENQRASSYNSDIVLAIEEGNEDIYTLELIGKDKANNAFNMTVGGILLDHKAPEVTVTEQNPTFDENNRLAKEYTFSISDFSGEGKVYYYIDTAGLGASGLPTMEEANAEKTTGTVSSLYNQWAYVEQGTGSTDGSAMVYVALSEEFTGTMYYYTNDSSGNKGELQSIPISLTNYDITPVITSEQIGYYKDYSITLSNQAGADMSYRWLDSTGTAITDLVTVANGTTINTSSVSGSWHGSYTLEAIATSGLTSVRTTTQDFTFDHEAPTLDISIDNPGNYADTHYITVTSADSGAGIATISGQFMRADGTAEGEEFTVDADTYSYKETYSLGELTDTASGAYRLRITSTDKNGMSITTTSNLIYIRNSAPELTVTASAEHTYNESYPVVAEGGDYSITMSVYEDFINAGQSALSTANEQYVYYRAKVNGGSANWTKAGALSVAADESGTALDAFEGEFTIKNPATLVPGENIIEVDVVIAAEGRSIYEDEVVEGDLGDDPLRVATEYFTIYCDDEAPEYTLSLENDRTSGNIEGRLVVKDNYASDFTVESKSDSITVTETERDTSESELEYDEDGNVIEDETTVDDTEEETLYYTTYTVTVTDNTDSEVVVYDEVGNSITVPVTVTAIDREGPTAALTDSETLTVGARTDAKATITMYDMDLENDTFALAVIPASEVDTALDEDGNVDSSYFNTYEETVKVTKTEQTAGANDGEADNTYEIYLGGFDGDYCLAVRGTDSLGNEATTLFADTVFTVIDAAAELTMASASPTEAYKRSKATLTANVPVYVLPQSMITAEAYEVEGEEDTGDDGDGLDAVDMANLELANNYATSYTQETSLVITGNGDYTFYVCDDLGRTSKLIVNIGEEYVTFGHEVDEPTVERYVTTEYELYDDTGTYVETVTKTELLADGEYAPSGNATAWAMPYEGYAYANETKYAVIEVTAADGTYLWPMSGEATDTSWYDGLYLKADESDLTEYGYTKMVYSAYQVFDSDYNIPDQPLRELPLYVCTATTFADGIGNWQQESVYVEYIDNTEPEISVSYDPMLYDPTTGSPNYTLGDVTIEVLMRDPESGMRNIYVDASKIVPVTDGDGYTYNTYEEITDDDVIYSIMLVDNDGNPIDYMTEPYTESNTYYDLEVYSDTDLRSTKVMRLTIHQNAAYNVEITSMTDLRNWPDGEGMTVESINKIELSDAEYELKYYYLDSESAWQDADPADEDTYFKKGKAVLTTTASGDERGVYITNNNGSGEKELSLFENSYTFSLKDKYGYTLDVPAALTNFDETAGTLTYELDESSAQQAVLTVTASDALSGVGSVTLTYGDSVETLSAASAVNGEYTYTKTLTESGTYTLTLYDNVGNKTSKVFAVTSIDTVKPEITDIAYSTTSTTTKAVTAKIYYSKANVTITSVEYVSETAAFEYDVDYENSIIRFYDNGTLGVYFADSAGNSGYGTVGVNNITEVPPSLSAVATVAADQQSVDVTFEKALDENLAPIDQTRELYEVTVMFNGIAQRAQTIDDDGNVTDEAKFTFTENGTYTFTVYDDEGTTSYITIEITGIDKSAPKVTQVSWSYNYDVLNDNGEWETLYLSDTWTVEDEAGYVIATDSYPITNYNVDVTIETDKETTIAGKSDSDLSTQHTLTYSDDGMYIFNVEKTNGMISSYGFDVEVIDKVPPVIELEESYLIFYENPEMGQSYDRSVLDDKFKAYDTFMGETTDLTDSVTIDYGNFDPTDVYNNDFDRSKPYTITYSVTDSAHNTTEVRMTVTLVALTDTIALVNGSLPDSANRIKISSKDITVKLQNFSGVAYAKIEKSLNTLGEMKTAGTVIPMATNEAGETISGEFKYTVEENGWYTILVQTDKRDYFNLQIYVWESE